MGLVPGLRVGSPTSGWRCVLRPAIVPEAVPPSSRFGPASSRWVPLLRARCVWGLQPFASPVYSFGMWSPFGSKVSFCHSWSRTKVYIGGCSFPMLPPFFGVESSYSYVLLWIVGTSCGWWPRSYLACHWSLTVGCLLLASSAAKLWVLGMLTCCPVVVRPPFVWPWVSLPSFLSFALQLALVVHVPVGSLLPYGSQPSRWGHPCGVEAGLILDRNEGLVCFSFPFGLFLRVATVLREWSPYGSSVLVGFHLYATSGCHWCLALYPYGWTSSLCLRPLFAPCRYRRVSWWSSLRPRVLGCSWLSPVFFPIRCSGSMSTSMALDHGLRLSLVLCSRSFRMGFEPLSEASLCALPLPACISWWSSLRQWVFGSSWLSPLFFPIRWYGYMITCIALDPVRRLSFLLGPISFDPLSWASLRACRCWRVYWWSSQRPRGFESSGLSPVFFPFLGPTPVSRMFLCLRPRSRSPFPSLAPSWWSPCPLWRSCLADALLLCPECALRLFLCVGLVCRSRPHCRPSRAVSWLTISVLCA